MMIGWIEKNIPENQCSERKSMWWMLVGWLGEMESMLAWTPLRPDNGIDVLLFHTAF
jgi:hypothetical protein